MYWDEHDPATTFLDEVELAIGSLEKRSESGLTPKHEALRVIVRVASSYHDDLVPPDRTQLPRVPRDRDGWVRLLQRTLQEAEGSIILHDPAFVDDVAAALRRLGCESACVEFVNDAVSRGVLVNRRALDEAIEAQSHAYVGEKDMSAIRMLALED